GYQKPIMLAGGLGNINAIHVKKQDTQKGDYIVVLGGPAMLIGLGGGAASSISSGDGQEELDFASVQRGNPEMQRRCQEVIDRCTSRADASPIRSIHDVGAGGLSNAIPEILDDASVGGEIELRELQIDHSSMSPMEIWCNESQERYVISIIPEKMAEFKMLCERERCPFAVLGYATEQKTLRLNDKHFDNKPVDIPMSLLFGNTPKTSININTKIQAGKAFRKKITTFSEAFEQVLKFPAVASKKYLITIGDRTVSGMVYRDQMVGPWQVPVADCGITLRDYCGYAGEALSLGERTPLALINPAASARMAVTEAITNIAGVYIGKLNKIKLSANWMAASNQSGEYQNLYEAVHAVGMEFCPALGIGIPVGKDSLSMHTSWQENDEEKSVTSPMSLIISAFAAVDDVRLSCNPQLSGQKGSRLFYLDLGQAKNRMGGSIYYQIQNQLGEVAPDVDEPELLLSFYDLIQTSIKNKLINAYHDKSDGGLIVTVAEMCFAGRCGVKLDIGLLSGQNTEEKLFNEEAGAVVEVGLEQLQEFQALIDSSPMAHCVHDIGSIDLIPQLLVCDGDFVYEKNIFELETLWSQTSHHMALLRDNPASVQQEAQLISSENKGIVPKVGFDFSAQLIAPYINTAKPKIALLREQGVNGQNEMAAAFMRAGFDCVDIHMYDLLTGKNNLQQFNGLVACGGFSYGDVLGAGLGWAKTILFNQALRQQFLDYFGDESKFSLGVCNGCQMLSGLKELIPGTTSWPVFLRNTSEQFEARFSQLQIQQTNNMFFKGMAGAHIPVAISHGEGRANFGIQLGENTMIAAKYIDNHGRTTLQYPFNPNGSEHSVAAVGNHAGNVLIMMPHPERVFRTVQMSWAPSYWGENSPWMRMFYNARNFLN
ncbi:MAG: phosphoribosylformylglycinamidine synthase, partial [Proteobacteria bacterium]|nr:phosphoribosylformylglycinamidine synthase [Pseudomonadota bacterium]